MFLLQQIVSVPLLSRSRVQRLFVETPENRLTGVTGVVGLETYTLIVLQSFFLRFGENSRICSLKRTDN